MSIVNRAQCEEKIKSKFAGRRTSQNFKNCNIERKKKLDTTNKRTSKIQFNP